MDRTAHQNRCTCGHGRVVTPEPLGADMHAVGCPVRPSDMDALHAEAIAMDAEETAKAEAQLRGWTRFHYTATKMRARFDANLQPANYRVGVVSGYVFAGRESDALDRVHDTVAGERFMYLTDIFLTPTR